VEKTPPASVATCDHLGYLVAEPLQKQQAKENLPESQQLDLL
jgi:hypothetical protein